MTSLPEGPWIRLYVPVDSQPLRVIPSPYARTWYRPGMYHCLPLTMAGQLGWTVLNPAAFVAVWDGRDGVENVRVGLAGQARHAYSHFGHGIVTIWPGFYVRTSPEVNLLVKVVPNVVKDGMTMLEGLVETDWFDGSFTVNLRLTRPGLVVAWDRDEPLFQLVPYPRGWLERFRTEISTDGPDHAAFFTAADRWERDRFDLIEAEERQAVQIWDGQYRRGRRHDGVRAPASHQTRLAVPPFRTVGASAEGGSGGSSGAGVDPSTRVMERKGGHDGR